MSCYFRHMKDIFEEAGIEVSPSNKKKIDQVIHKLVGVEYKNCSDTWSKIKELKASENVWADFINNLKTTWAEID